jgi:hypothetical protein
MTSAIAIAKVCITAGLVPRPVMLRQLGFSPAAVRGMIGRRMPIKSIPEAPRVPQVPMIHTCEGMEWDLDGPSPSEFCDACQHSMCEYSRLNPVQTSFNTRPEGSEDAWVQTQVYRYIEDHYTAARDVSGIMELDEYRGSIRPWSFYAMFDDSVDVKKFYEEFKDFKAKQEEFGYWYQPAEVEAKRKQVEEELRAYRKALAGVKPVDMPDNAREYIRSVDRRSGKEREVEFEEWLAIPKNKRPIYLEGGKKGPAVAKADIGSVVIKNCPPSVLLCDIRVVLSKFGGVRDVYRPRDRATGKAKPFVFVEMLKNADAWSAVDHFAKHPFVLDDNTFTTEGAGERKTSEEMAIIKPINVEVAEPAALDAAEPKEAKKPVEKSKPTGAFGALMDSDSDDE